MAITMSKTFMPTGYIWFEEFVTPFSIMFRSSYLQFIPYFSFQLLRSSLFI